MSDTDPIGTGREIGDRHDRDEYGFCALVQAHESSGLLIFVLAENIRKHGRGEAAGKRLRIRLLLSSQPLMPAQLKDAATGCGAP